MKTNCGFVILFLLFILSNLTDQTSGLLSISHQLCCKPEQLLTEDKKCVELTFSAGADPFESYKDVLKNPLFKCPSGSKMTFFTIPQATNGSLIEPLSNQTILEENFCVQPSTRFGFNGVLLCRRPIEIRKCCPIGQYVNRTSVTQCIASKEGSFNNLPVTRIVDPGYDDEWISIQENAPLHCDFDYNVYLPGYYSDHRFKVNNERGLYVHKAVYKAIRESTNYCVDSTVYANGTKDFIAMICLPKTFYVMRWLLLNVYSIINFISAVLVLVTFLVYLMISHLRENIQGYSMLCFFACLIIMHFENGVYLSLRQEPHIWCLNKACVSGYFRFASSTWITVMGYNIWRQLRSKVTRRMTKRQLTKSFVIRCLYAWGLPLILTLVSHYYKEYNGCSSKFKRCWSCDSVSRNLAQGPNIILVTGNLVFFIPSALKIYKSLSFLQLSVPKHNLSQIETGRIHTIFRLFVLMQFYTVPRIIQWFVDSDRANPELLMLCATIFLMIGPCVFYSFVCRPEILNTIKANISRKTRPYRCKISWKNSRTYQVNDTTTVSTISTGVFDSTASAYRSKLESL